jgi:replicative DNA helicase
MDNIRLKFTGHLAQFSDLEEGFGTEFQSKMNTSIPESAQNMNPSDAFDEGDVPF